MESPDQYNFSIFRPRNFHGKKNRNVIFTMLLIWSVAVFGFQILLRVLEKPTPEKSLILFESTWPAVVRGDATSSDYKTFLNSLILVRGKNIVKPGDQKLLNEAISYAAFKVLPPDIKNLMDGTVTDLNNLKARLAGVKDQEYLEIKNLIIEKYNVIVSMSEPYTDLKTGSLEATILASTIQSTYPESLSGTSFAPLPEIMKFYLTHNQSSLTDTKFLGFPFHYFYTAVFLLVLFVCLCIIYNMLIEWRLNKEGIVE